MQSSSGDLDESGEDIPGRKKSKLRSLRSRLFGRAKRAGEEDNAKLSQSASDIITAGKGLGSEEDLACSQGIMASRAMSHESIFLDDQVLKDAEPVRILSQENVSSSIKALQTKLQQQKMHLGPPVQVLPLRRSEDPGVRSEDNSGPHGPPDLTEGGVKSQGAYSKPSSRPLSPTPKPVLTRSVAPLPSHPPFTVPSIPSVVEPPLDFSSPAQFTPHLDTSAARHRMSVKPRNQRASTKRRPSPNGPELHSNTLNNNDLSESVREDTATLESHQGEADIPTKAQLLPPRAQEAAAVASGATSKSSSLPFPHQDPALPERTPSVSSQVRRPKPQRPADAAFGERPHLSLIESELESKREGWSEIQALCQDRRDTLKKSGMTEDSSGQDRSSAASSSAVAFKSLAVHQQVPGELQSTPEMKRPAPGSGSFHFSITTARKRDEERSRSSSFSGILEQARCKTIVSDLKEKGELGDLQSRGRSCTVGRLNQDEDPPKSLVLPWNRRDKATDTSRVAVEELESKKEEVEEAVEAQEEEGRTAFGVKLRSASQSVRLHPNAASNHLSKSPACEDQSKTENRQDKSDNVGSMSKKPPTKRMCMSPAPEDVRVTDPAPPGLCLPKSNLPPTGDSHIAPAEVRGETALAAPQEPQTAPQTASWMSLATKSLQQLFTSRLPRDLTAVQTQSSTAAQAANQPPADAMKAATAQSKGQAQTLRASPLLVQQKTSGASSGPSKAFTEAQTFRQTQSLPTATQPPSHPPAQTKTWATPPLWHSSKPAEGEREVNAQEKEGPPLSGRHGGWGGSVSERAAFLEKRAERATPAGAKEVELRKVQTGEATSDDSLASAKTTALSTSDPKPECRQDSSPSKVPDRPREDKWLRKNMASSSPSSSPTQSSMSDGGQPSWMELAKRKSMAWSDKTMD